MGFSTLVIMIAADGDVRCATTATHLAVTIVNGNQLEFPWPSHWAPESIVTSDEEAATVTSYTSTCELLTKCLSNLGKRDVREVGVDEDVELTRSQFRENLGKVGDRDLNLTDDDIVADGDVQIVVIADHGLEHLGKILEISGGEPFTEGKHDASELSR